MTTKDNSDHTDDAVELLGPPPESAYYGYYRKDWIDLCEDIKGNDRTVYGVLRSLVYESRGTRNNRCYKLSLNDMCALIPGAGGKPITLGGLRDSLRRLSRVGLVSDPDGKPLTTSSSKKAAARTLRMRIHDVPCNDYKPRWRNTEEKLKAIQTGWESNQAPEVGWESNQPGWESNQPGWQPNHDSRSDLEKREPYILPSATSLPSSPSVPEPRQGKEGEDPRNEDNLDITAGGQLVSRLPGQMRGSQRQELGVLASRLLTAGWGVKILTRELTTDLGGVRSHFAVYRKRMRELIDLTPVADAAPETPMPAVAVQSCRADCQDGQLVCSGACTADCTGTHEPRGSACPQCNGTSRKPTSAAESLVNAILDAHRVPMSRRAAPAAHKTAQGFAQRLLDAGMTAADITAYAAQQGSLETTSSPVGDLAERLRERTKVTGSSRLQQALANIA